MSLAVFENMAATQKVILLCCASSFVIAAYFYVRFIPQDSCALHNDLFTLPPKYGLSAN
jgi:hypothetical protein